MDSDSTQDRCIVEDMDSKKGSRGANLRTSAKESRISQSRENVSCVRSDWLICSRKRRRVRNHVELTVISSNVPRSMEMPLHCMMYPLF